MGSLQAGKQEGRGAALVGRQTGGAVLAFCWRALPALLPALPPPARRTWVLAGNHFPE